MFADADNDHHVSIDEPYTHHLSDAETPTEGVLEAVSAASGRPVVPDGPTAPLPPLYAAIDPDALDALFESVDGTRPGPTISFEYFGCEVTVRAGEVTVDARH